MCTCTIHCVINIHTQDYWLSCVRGSEWSNQDHVASCRLCWDEGSFIHTWCRVCSCMTRFWPHWSLTASPKGLGFMSPLCTQVTFWIWILSTSRDSWPWSGKGLGISAIHTTHEILLLNSVHRCTVKELTPGKKWLSLYCWWAWLGADKSYYESISLNQQIFLWFHLTLLVGVPLSLSFLPLPLRFSLPLFLLGARVDTELYFNGEHGSLLYSFVTLSIVHIHPSHQPLQLKCHILYCRAWVSTRW